MVPKTLLPLRVASQRIERTPEVTLRLITAGRLAGQRIGARWYVSIPDIERFRREHAMALHDGPALMAGAR